jgi:streptogramin lyase
MGRSVAAAVPLIVNLLFSSTSAAVGAEPTIRRIPVDAIPNDVVVFQGSLWVADGNRRVLEIDPLSGEILQKVHVLGGVQSVAAGLGAVWAASDHGTFRIDPDEGMAERTEVRYSSVVAVGAGQVWSQNGDGSVSRLDPASGHIEMTARGAEDVGDLQSRTTRDLAVQSHGAWLADGTTGQIVRFSATGKVERFPIGPPFERISEDAVQAGAYASTVAAGGGSIWACCDLEERVVRLDPATGQVTGRVEVPVGGGDVAMTFANGSLWMSESLGGIYRVDPRTLRPTGPVEFDRFPSALAVGESAVWVVQGDSSGDLSSVSLRDFPRLVGLTSRARSGGVAVLVVFAVMVGLVLAISAFRWRAGNLKPA